MVAGVAEGERSQGLLRTLPGPHHRNCMSLPCTTASRPATRQPTSDAQRFEGCNQFGPQMYWSQQLTTGVLDRSCAGRRGAAGRGTHTHTARTAVHGALHWTAVLVWVHLHPTRLGNSHTHRSHSGTRSAALDSRVGMGALAPHAAG